MQNIVKICYYLPMVQIILFKVCPRHYVPLSNYYYNRTPIINHGLQMKAFYCKNHALCLKTRKKPLKKLSLYLCIVALVDNPQLPKHKHRLFQKCFSVFFLSSPYSDISDRTKSVQYIFEVLTGFTLNPFTRFSYYLAHFLHNLTHNLCKCMHTFLLC